MPEPRPGDTANALSAAIGRQTNTRWSALMSEQATWVFLAALAAAGIVSPNQPTITDVDGDGIPLLRGEILLGIFALRDVRHGVQRNANAVTVARLGYGSRNAPRLGPHWPASVPRAGARRA